MTPPAEQPTAEYYALAFHVGDRVRVLLGPHTGQLGVVNGVFPYPTWFEGENKGIVNVVLPDARPEGIGFGDTMVEKVEGEHAEPG